MKIEKEIKITYHVIYIARILFVLPLDIFVSSYAQ